MQAKAKGALPRAQIFADQKVRFGRLSGPQLQFAEPLEAAGTSEIVDAEKLVLVCHRFEISDLHPHLIVDKGAVEDVNAVRPGSEQGGSVA